MKAELVPEDGSSPIPITRDVTVVGRRAYCDVQIDHPSLSKRHAVLVKTEGLLILRDLVSTNGTKVKGQRIRWAALLPEDRISFGSRKFRVYLGPDSSPGPSERNLKGKDLPAKVGAAPGGFAAPSPLGMPAVSAASAPRSTTAPMQLNEHELLIEDDDEIIELEDDDEVVDLT